MAFFPLFLSVVYVVRNQESTLPDILQRATETLQGLVSDYELIVVDNASEDGSVAVLERLTQRGGLPNLQVYVLTKEVESDTASWVGLENALGDFVAVIDPFEDDIAFLPQMLDHAASGTDVVFAQNRMRPPRSLAYRCAYSAFNFLYKRFSGIHLSREAPLYRLLSRRVINFILRHPHPAMAYRHLPATAGFTRTRLDYSTPPLATTPKRLSESLDRGMRLLVSTTRGPMRLVTVLSLFGAAANLVYSAYVVAVALFHSHVEPGWVSLSLQQSGMFFLISLVLLVLGEYIAQLARFSTEGPLYHIAQEFTSADLSRKQRLNVEDVSHSTPVSFKE